MEWLVNVSSRTRGTTKAKLGVPRQPRVDCVCVGHFLGPGSNGANTQYIVTSLTPAATADQSIYTMTSFSDNSRDLSNCADDFGLDEVPCIVLAHLTPAQRRAYVLADNKPALNAGWDLEMLSPL